VEEGCIANDDMAFTNITEAIKDVAQAIKDNKPIDMHPDLYSAVADIVGFSEEALKAGLIHLVDHKAQGTSFVSMVPRHIGSYGSGSF
jgi:hypothetical protein